MRHGYALLFGLLAALIAGCAANEPVLSTSWLDRHRPFQGPTGPDVVQIDFALVEQPVGDRYLNQDLWTLVDEQVVPFERNKGQLEDHGFRIGRIGGSPPAGLLALLTSEKSCPKPRQTRRHAGDPATVLLGPALPQCKVSVGAGEHPDLLDLEQAEFALKVLPTLTGDGRTRLQFTPLVEHGKHGMTIGTAADRSGWMLQDQRQKEPFDCLSWEVTLAPNEYLIVGGRLDRPGSPGHVSFIRDTEKPPVQRLLVIRTSRSVPGIAGQLPLDTAEEDESADDTLPLAAQAGGTTLSGR